MLRAAAIGMLVGIAASEPIEARPRHQIDATPFSHAPCSVLPGEPCAPTFCSVFNRGPCIPEISYPIGENLQLTVLSDPPHDEATRYQKPDHDLNTIGDLFTALRACWSPPRADAARGGMQISVLFSFKSSGVMIAPPRVTYATRDAGAELRNSYLSAVKSSLDDCLPLTFTPSLAGAIAGRPIMIRYVDNRSVANSSSSPR
jgi:hypothetical protein